MTGQESAKTPEKLSRETLFGMLDLSKRERAVLDALERQQMASTVPRIARRAGIPRTTALYILNKFARLGLAEKRRAEKHDLWQRNKKLRRKLK